MSSIPYDLSKICAFVFDVDGVLSQEVIALHPEAGPMRTVNIKDGYAMQLAVKMGYEVAIITGAYTESVRVRYERLGLRHIYMSSAVKIRDYEDFLLKTGLTDEQVLYAGDDIPDYEIMSRVGLSVAPSDAAPEIKQVARYISLRKGGEGIARDVIEQTLRAQGHWFGKEAFGW